MLLDGVVGEVDEGVVQVAVQTVGLPRQSDIAAFAEVKFHLLGQEGPHSDIEFSALNEQGFFNVFLDDEGTGLKFVGFSFILIGLAFSYS